jgi:hypothetical protein
VDFLHLTPPYLADQVAVPLAKYCKSKYGKKGFRVQQELEANLEWRPTIQIQSSKFETLAIEIAENLHPAILKTVSYDLLHNFANRPVVVYVGCPLTTYQADERHRVANQLRMRGFGLFTVDDLGSVIEQIPGIPIIHHISSEEVRASTKDLPPSVRVKVERAYDVYRMRSYQGLQDVAQVVEALVFGFAINCQKAGWIASAGGNVADVLDSLYSSAENKLKGQRAAIGMARGFIKFYRNISSHPPKTTAKAAELIRSCRRGFLSALETATALTNAARACGKKVHLFLP